MTINFLNIAQVLVAVALIIFILIQRGPGATAGSAFGGGASGTVFGAKGSGSFLTKSTAILATLFFIITMLIAIDARDTYAASGEAANQDLGVIGTLDSDNQEPAMVPEGDGAIDVSGVIDAVEQAGDEVQQTAEQTGDAIKDAATDAQDVMVETADQAAQTVENAAEEVAEKIKETVDKSDEDSDDGDQ
ncbi:MAG: preprotein translocase subunit SecG [Marinicella sp.]|nr:preprotein translocase subunit SecG [Xanthomonadales bacterium]